MGDAVQMGADRVCARAQQRRHYALPLLWGDAVVGWGNATLVLGKFYGVSANDAPLYLITFAVGNLAGPLLLGPLFDTWSRKKMISGTYLLSGVLLAITAWLFYPGLILLIPIIDKMVRIQLRTVAMDVPSSHS